MTNEPTPRTDAADDSYSPTRSVVYGMNGKWRIATREEWANPNYMKGYVAADRLETWPQEPIVLMTARRATETGGR